MFNPRYPTGISKSEKERLSFEHMIERLTELCDATNRNSKARLPNAEC